MLQTILLCVLRAQNFPELETFVATALNEHPRMAEFYQRLEQAGYRYEEIFGFFDPSARLATGASDEIRTLPGWSGFGSLSSEAYEIQASLEVPVRPGFFLSVGAAERYLRHPEEFDHLYQSLAGIGIRIPLLQDRGFSLWSLDRQLLLAEYDRMLSEYLAARQRLRHDVEQTYFSVWENLALEQIAAEATARSEALVREAQGLAEHQALAEYQVYAAQTEFELSKAEQLLARQRLKTARLFLAELLNADTPPKLSLNRKAWLNQMSRLPPPEMLSLKASLRNRGDFLSLLNRQLALQFAIKKNRESLRPEVSLQAMATWQAENEDALWAADDSSGENRPGGHIMLIYERPLGFRAEKSRLAAGRSRLAELQAQSKQIEIKVQRDLKSSHSRLEFASKRIQEATRAVEFAGQNLKAEEERFRLGEARSRHVLDAQKDVTKAQRAQIAAVAGFLKALSDYNFATGYPSHQSVHEPVETLKRK